MCVCVCVCVYKQKKLFTIDTSKYLSLSLCVCVGGEGEYMDNVQKYKYVRIKYRQVPVLYEKYKYKNTWDIWIPPPTKVRLTIQVLTTW